MPTMAITVDPTYQPTLKSSERRPRKPEWDMKGGRSTVLLVRPVLVA
jgi:hypothetical protein